MNRLPVLKRCLSVCQPSNGQQITGLLFFLLTLLLYLNFQLWFSQHGLLAIYTLRQQAEQQLHTQQILLQSNRILESNIMALQKDTAMLEEYARASLGMLYPNEVIFRFIQVPQAPQQ